ncbi:MULTISPECIES: preprotein translocase subunit YajC [unclassified Caulobacter]|uniref:preprotein translocase subunit YajC n=1 Tax=unclassified Caulobacter TaxID=2648921 RepID=UPI001F0928DB|nr:MULTISPECIES: preprotein translocase subunit YajC [unclassified Caulobacter]
MAPADAGPMAFVVQFAPLLLIFVLFYFLLIRPQQKKAKEHQALVEAVKRGDTVVLSNGMIGKVTRVEDAEAMVEIAQGVNVRVVKSMIADVRNRTEPAPANDAKASSR